MRFERRVAVFPRPVRMSPSEFGSVPSETGASWASRAGGRSPWLATAYRVLRSWRLSAGVANRPVPGIHQSAKEVGKDDEHN